MKILSEDEYEERDCPPHLTIQGLIIVLKALPSTILMESVSHCASYRGLYDELALEMAEPTVEPCRPAKIIEQLQQSLQTSFAGYKGGTYRMFESTPVWVSNYGEASDLAIVGVEIEDGKAGFIVRHIP